MKTTIDIADALLARAKEWAAADGLTLRALVEEGLRRVLAERDTAEPFRMRRASFAGRGLHPGVPEGDWEAVRARAYESRGA